MPLVRPVFVFALLLAAYVATPVSAQPSLVPQDTKWGLTIDVNKLFNSGLGRTLEERAKAEEGQDIDAMIGQVSEIFGVDLRNDVSTLAAFGNGFEPQDGVLILGIGQAQTNIEGLLLAAEGYESYTYGGEGDQGVMIHSALPEEKDRDKGRYYVAVMPGENGVAFTSHDKQRVEAMVDQVKAGASLAPVDLEGDMFMRAYVNDLPGEAFQGDGPQSNIAAMVKGLEMTGSSGEQTAITLTATMVDEARARQIEQLVRGGLAMLEMAAADDQKAAAALDLSDYLAITRNEGEPRVTVDLRVETAELGKVMDLLKAME